MVCFILISPAPCHLLSLWLQDVLQKLLVLIRDMCEAGSTEGAAQIALEATWNVIVLEEQAASKVSPHVCPASESKLASLCVNPVGAE